MRQTLTVLYDSSTSAHAAMATLATIGIPRSAMVLIDGAPVGLAASSGACEAEALPSATIAALLSLSLSNVEFGLYDAALRRGSVLLRLTVEEVEVSRAMNILNDCGSVDLDARSERWRREGWGGTSPVATEGWHGYSATATAGEGIAAHAAPEADDGGAR